MHLIPTRAHLHPPSLATSHPHMPPYTHPHTHTCNLTPTLTSTHAPLHPPSHATSHPHMQPHTNPHTQTTLSPHMHFPHQLSHAHMHSHTCTHTPTLHIRQNTHTPASHTHFITQTPDTISRTPHYTNIHTLTIRTHHPSIILVTRALAANRTPCIMSTVKKTRFISKTSNIS